MRTLSLVVTLSAFTTPLWAADFTVTRTDDPAPDGVTLSQCRVGGDCSLREAVLAANKRPGPDRILLGRAVYELTRATSATTPDGRSGPLLVTDTLDVAGAGSARTRVRWRSGVTPPHMFTPHKHPVWTASGDYQIDLQAMTISGGRGAAGGCIDRWAGDLNLRDVVVESCEGTTGGAIHFGGAYTSEGAGAYVLSLVDTTLRDNLAQYGGALFLRQTGTVIGDGARLLDNTALQHGGAVEAVPAETTVISYALQMVWRSEGDGTQVADNSAGGNGGGFSLVGPGYANIFSVSGAAPIVFERNVAVGEGGAISMRLQSFASPVAGTTAGMTLEQARLYDNAAASGGAVMLRAVRAVMNDIEFARNSAQNGSGGAIAADYATSGSRQSLLAIQRASFNQNHATQRGGAISSQCQIVSAYDSSFHANTSIGNGEVISSTGYTNFIHVSTDGHGQPTMGPASLHLTHHTACPGSGFTIANSVIGGTDNCYGQHGIIMSNGGNQFSSYAGGCYFQAGLDAYGSSASFALSVGTFGGDKSVLGWTNDGITRPQVNFGQPSLCSITDVRGLPRNVGACDAGAFEQQW